MRFNLKVYREQGGLQQLQLEALDSVAAQRLAEEQGYTVLATAATTTRSWLGLGRPGFSLPLFVQELLALLEAGMGLVEALAILNKKARSPETQRVLGTLSQLLSEGRTFSRALESVPEAFPVLFVATVRSSEQTGNVHEALRRYLAYHRQLHALREKMISASVYPLLLALVGILVVVFLMVYVVPRFSKVYEDVGQGNLPFLSLLLMNWGRWAGEHVSIVVISLVGLLGTAIYLAVHPATRAMIERRLWALPVLGEHLYVMQLSRFTRTVAMLLKGGVPLLSALEMTADLLRQPALQRGLDVARQAIAEG
ncbi:MAG TPA: type II secretion system F family protein, partial [Rhodocyclaceae bacterium]|nr:type II secretion system F family protein [Rhodocyclaceae bacterium]